VLEGSTSSLYDQALAHVQAVGYGAMAAAVAPQIVSLLRRRGISGGTIGDVGCGAGVATRFFLEAGYDVWAIDQSPWLLAAARAAAPSAWLFPCTSIYDATLPRANAIVAIGEVLNYHRPDANAQDRVLRLFAQAAASLPPGGLLAFDVIVSGSPSLAGRTWTAGEGWAILQTIDEDRDAGTLRRELEILYRLDGEAFRHAHETHHIRVFEPGVLRRGLRQSGFSVETAPAYGTHHLAPRRMAFFCVRT
jgi:SAM-dependent methyltransferase